MGWQYGVSSSKHNLCQLGTGLKAGDVRLNEAFGTVTQVTFEFPSLAPDAPEWTVYCSIGSNKTVAGKCSREDFWVLQCAQHPMSLCLWSIVVATEVVLRRQSHGCPEVREYQLVYR
ncbi:hypothetical protein DdX_20052 [Ditylenchus destructor]|uniref:Uncharacterized protein n=1 Tax=Ditylenchus destructor TaxID=166010 RepID=A0AAD4MLH9_9BILA|nr:hypothetical protein DdX_20052 [Ditylenchus destructor]